MTKENKRRLPRFPGALYIPNEEGEFGYYLPLLDTLLIPVETWDVRRHEAAHRAFAHSGTMGNDLLLMRNLVGMSHALLLQIPGLAYKNGVFVHGKRLGHLSLSGGSPQVQSTMMDLLHRTEYVESIIDKIWQGLEPVAEFAAIDFAEGMDPRDSGYNSWSPERIKRISQEERKEIDEKKLQLIKMVAGRYPSDFGGYHVKFGSFQEAFLRAWEMYNAIEDDHTRRELLRLSMSCVYLEGDQIMLLDPLDIILSKAEFAKNHSQEAKGIFFNERQIIVIKAFELIAQLEKQLFSDIDDDSLKGARYWIRLLDEVVTKVQDQPILSVSYGIYDVMAAGTGPWYSFLRFVMSGDDENEYNVVHINPLILNAVDEKSPGFANTWLSMLLVREAFRQTLKSGESMVCPFQGWEKQCESRHMECSVNCYIRGWLEPACD